MTHHQTQDQTQDQLALFGTDVLLPPLQLPNNLLVMQENALASGDVDQVLALHQNWSAERADRAVWDTGNRAWCNAICGPKVTPDPGRCRPVLLSVDLRCRSFGDHQRLGCSCVGDLLYRHACVQCGHVDQARDRENTAAEDAMDHAWPGWRDLPILACSQPQETKQQAKWLNEATRHYPAGWIEAGGPVRTARGRHGGRHVPDRTPYGGYDLGVIVADEHHTSRYQPGLYQPTPRPRMSTRPPSGPSDTITSITNLGRRAHSPWTSITWTSS